MVRGEWRALTSLTFWTNLGRHSATYWPNSVRFLRTTGSNFLTVGRLSRAVSAPASVLSCRRGAARGASCAGRARQDLQVEEVGVVEQEQWRWRWWSSCAAPPG